MRILWISSLAWKTQGQYPYPVNGAGAVAGSLFQQSIIEQLEQLGHQVDLVCTYPYAPGTDPGRQVRWSHREGGNDIWVKTWDAPYISVLYNGRSLKKAVLEQTKDTSYDLAVAYLIHQPFLAAAALAGKKGAKTVLICPDLPDMMDMSLSQKKLKRWLKKLDSLRICKLYQKMDGFVLFAEAMKEQIPMADKPYTVIEGVATVDDLDITPVERENTLIYAGTLHRNIGIENIIKAMDHLRDTDVSLTLYGTGELEEQIKALAEEDPRIRYGGFVDRQCLFARQKAALAMVNARNPKDAYTRYSFPSKTFEYLYSGTPFITTKLEGMPREYSKYLYQTENDSPEAIAAAVRQVLAMSPQQRAERGAAAREFVAREKNKKKQTEVFEAFAKKLLASVD